MTEEDRHPSVREGKENQEKREDLFSELQEMARVMKDIFGYLEKKELSKKATEEGCLRAIEEARNSLLSKKDDWGENKAKKIWKLLTVWETNSFFSDIQTLREKARKGEMPELQEELKLLEDEVRSATEDEGRKTISQKIKKYISRKKRNPLFY